ncbi:hypothetical protein M5K25_018253 [Dendrobium thyrsiflorum]|uniref:Uncharacterized protein n=1 Tax=Dendrobium thyrsiflorum TaxID=117978 RepID=A0ABD0UII3_DENTH
MAAKKVDGLEERLEGEMNQIKETVEERISSMEGQVADLRDMMKKMLEFQTQTAASEARGPEVKNTNSEIRREEDEVEIVEGERRRPHLEASRKEDMGGRYWEHQEGYGGRRGAPGYITTSLLNGTSFVEGWEENFFISKLSMQHLVIECPSIYELMGSLSFSWEEIPLLQIWREKHDSSGQVHALLESYEADEVTAIMNEALLGNNVSFKSIPF